MAQRGASRHDQWQGYMTVHVASHGIIKSISIHSEFVGLMIKFVVDNARDWFCQDIK
jgi:hypothetical protein